MTMFVLSPALSSVLSALILLIVGAVISTTYGSTKLEAFSSTSSSSAYVPTGMLSTIAAASSTARVCFFFIAFTSYFFD